MIQKSVDEAKNKHLEHKLFICTFSTYYMYNNTISYNIWIMYLEAWQIRSSGQWNLHNTQFNNTIININNYIVYIVTHFISS